MADNPQLTAYARQQLPKLPQFLLRGVDMNKLRVVQAPPTKGYHANAIASVDPTDPNTIRVHDMGAFMKPQAAAPLLAHEFAHVQQTRAAGGGMKAFAPVNHADPYSFDENNLGAKHASKYSPEQLAQMAQNYTQAMNEPGASDADKRAYMAKYQPTMTQFAQMPQSTIQTDQSAAQPNTINTAPNAPAAQPILSGLPADQAPPPAIVPQRGSGNDWEDVTATTQQTAAPAAVKPPQPAQPAPDEWEDVPQQQTPEQANKQSLQQGLIGAGKGLASDVIMGTPAAGLLMSGELGHGLDAKNPDQVAGKVANAGAQLALGGGADAVDGLISLAKTGIGKVTGSTAVDALHSSLGSTLQKVAADAGVEVKPTDNIRKVVSNVADAVRTKATEKMAEVDDAFQGLKFNARGAGGKFASGTGADLGYPENFSGFDEQIGKLNDKLRSMPGAQNIEKRAALQSQIKELTSARAQASNALDRQGLGGARDEADKLFTQADALDQLKAAHNRSTFGAPGKTNPVKFAKEVEPLHSDGTLHTALGEDHAESLMDTAGRASRTYARTQTAQKIVGAAGRLAVRGAAEGLGAGAAYRAVEGLTK